MHMLPNIEKAIEIDEAFSRSQDLDQLRSSMFGWSKAIREAIGLPVAELAKRMNISQPTLTNHELNEAKGSISLERLEAIAHALDCEFVYGFVPKRSLAEEAKNRQKTVDQARKGKRKIPRH